MNVDKETYLDASQSLNRLAKAFDENGDFFQSEKYTLLAAEIELSSSELQECWGGPFNGQEGRIDIISDLINEIDPDCIIETGSFRGVSTAWLARNFQKPIYTCEIERMHALQAIQNTKQFQNVTVSIEDSRKFLISVLERINPDSSVIFYLDAHWENDLPLVEELEIIYRRHYRSVVIIDDFMVPDDVDYGWDDYGEGKSLDVRMLAGKVPIGTELFFPTLPGHQESGARRGCCVIANPQPAQKIQTLKLRGSSLDVWLEKREETFGKISRQEIHAPERVNLSYPEVIRSLRGEINQLNRHIEAIERDRAQRLSDVLTLTQEIKRLRGEFE
ncbi:hypothetical protein [Methylobacterium sp. NEAU K]|uniref:hypothetical protein n=1 Tax=Methylobacterium sp. NEAU K TaxID=3064946 RepID=UPI00273301AE|nr:hypothetical protein [Methylobacterium sp. NEAU K]MDP4002719.1 hypothetical protein [Methylobacterium sp. NEAU K]